MKKSLLIYFLSLLCCSGFAQHDQRPSRSRFWNSKLSTFSIERGDILVYDVNKGDTQYNYIATVKNFGSTINFDYNLPLQSAKGNITIQPGAVSNAFKYDTLNSIKTELSDESILWLSQKNYQDLWTDKTTTMDLGNGNEIFERKSTGTLKINYKGKGKIITVYNVENKSAKSKTSLAVLSNGGNPLIVKMDAGWRITLKEVR